MGGHYVSGTSSSGGTLAGSNAAAPAPTFGGIVYYIGVLIIVIGIAIALLSVIVYMWGRIRGTKEQQPDGEPTSTRS